MDLNSNLKVTDKMSFSVQKNVESYVKVTGRLHIRHYGPDGNLIREDFIENTVTTAGKAGIAQQIIASPALGKPTHMAVGTGVPSGTLLGAEIARVALSSKTATGATVSMSASFGAGVGTGAWIEAGIFDVVTANTVNMWQSTTFLAYNKAALDVIAINWDLIFS